MVVGRCCKTKVRIERRNYAMYGAMGLEFVLSEFAAEAAPTFLLQIVGAASAANLLLFPHFVRIVGHISVSNLHQRLG